MSKIKGSDFYIAKEKLGLLSFGDPGAGDKIQVTDTYLVSMARKIDNRIKSNPKLRTVLIGVRSKARHLKHVASQTKNARKKPQSQQTQAPDPIFDLGRVQGLAFPKIQKPVVSIIIPAFNKVALTVSCLESLMRNEDKRVPTQIIVIDNNSEDETPELKSIPNLTFIRNKENLGFVGGCNSGIPHALGEYIVFLNNDTEVDANWLYELYRTISQDSSIGLVGSKIIYPSGTLQEAGGVIFKDGTGLNYGKFDNADSYQYNYVRDVDYCSGASIIVPAALLRKLGGFDSLYQPAYYEDTDLCFRIRKEGLRVVYQPLSIIYHIEGGTAGTNLNSGFKKYQVINQEKFLKRWQETLKTSHQAPEDSYLGRDRSGDKLALIIEEALPTPDKDSGSVRMVAMIRALQELGYKVTFWPNNQKRLEPYAKNLQQMGVEVVYGNIDFLLFAKHYALCYDLVIMSRPEICARYINICRSLFNNAKLIYDTVDLHYVRLARQAEIEKANAEALLEQSKWYKVLETGLMERTDATLVVSSSELGTLKNEGVAANVQVVSNIHKIHLDAYRSGFKDREDVIFVGNYAHLPNRDAIRWFKQEIYPLIRKKLPNVKLHIVGANMPEDLKKEVRGPGVVVHGFISDETLGELLTKSRVFVAPLRYGAGVKGKVGQAIEFGLPTVSTPIAAEGMHINNQINGLIAEEAADFAHRVETLYSDKELWETVQKNAKDIIADYFSPNIAKKSLEKILAR